MAWASAGSPPCHQSAKARYTGKKGEANREAKNSNAPPVVADTPERRGNPERPDRRHVSKSCKDAVDWMSAMITRESAHVYTIASELHDNCHMKNLVTSQEILEKLQGRHGVTRREVEQCFENLEGPLLEDTREEHKSDPPTRWFLARTNQNRLLKVVYIQRDAKIYLRTCYAPNETEISIYARHS